MQNTVRHNNISNKPGVTYIVDENLNKLKGKILAPKKLEEANKLLRKLNSPLPR
jgi:hypothetical protein